MYILLGTQTKRRSNLGLQEMPLTQKQTINGFPMDLSLNLSAESRSLQNNQDI